MGDLIIRMQQNVGTYWILSIGEFHSSIVFCIVEYANPFMSKYITCIFIEFQVHHVFSCFLTFSQRPMRD